ncbi:hypothetical protein [Polynucleobacter brandtiae]|uniref:Lipoprotein n=1 Tax=Polynucleobacter brandtiae TaxID=1938816 RepID=A0A2M8VXU0_9BURK|nr:hypothetical protein [Polynucleobacter brandtiae]PJI82652.1 hypothetical protein B0G85_0026 [Polynucleobacter brandtiae]
MNIINLPALLLSVFTLLGLSACSTDKLEARLQADPQCKSVMNQKTGALMPCPGSDKAFYKSIPSLNPVPPKTAVVLTSGSQASPNLQSDSAKPSAMPLECKPQLHQKSGSLMPCPAP